MARYTLGEKWFMWRMWLYYRIYGFLWILASKVGFDSLSDTLYKRGFDCWEAGWECKNGM